jgi:hypothetical protein
VLGLYQAIGAREELTETTGKWQDLSSRTRSLGSLLYNSKNALIGGNLSFLRILTWIPIGAAAGESMG